MAVTWRNVNLNNGGAGLAAVGARQYEAGANRLTSALDRIDKRTAAEQADREAQGLAQFEQALINQTTLDPLNVADAIKKYGVNAEQAVDAYQTQEQLRRTRNVQDKELGFESRRVGATESTAAAATQNAETNAEGMELESERTAEDILSSQQSRALVDAQTQATQQEAARKQQQAIEDAIREKPVVKDRFYSIETEQGNIANKQLEALAANDQIMQVDSRLATMPTITEKMQYVDNRIGRLEEAESILYTDIPSQEIANSDNEAIKLGLIKSGVTENIEAWKADDTTEAAEDIQKIVDNVRKLGKYGEVTPEDVYVAAANSAAYTDGTLSEYLDEDKFENELKNMLTQRMRRKQEANDLYTIKKTLTPLMYNVERKKNETVADTIKYGNGGLVSEEDARVNRKR